MKADVAPVQVMVHRGLTMEPSDAFLRLQPLCVAVCKGRNVESLNSLTDAVDRISDDETLQRLQEYVIYPLKLILKLRERKNVPGSCNEDEVNSSSISTFPKEKIVESALRCLRAILKRTVVDSASTAVELFTSLLSILGHPKNGGRVDTTIGEDLKEEVAITLDSLVRNCQDVVKEQLCSVDFLPLWGHAVATLLFMSENEGGIGVATASMKTLVAFEQALPRQEAGVCFATFLPGIVVACLKILTRDEKQSHRVSCEALRLLTNSISLVLSNAQEGKNSDNEKQKTWKRLSSNDSASVKSNLLVQPTSEWRKNTWEKLGVVIEKLNVCGLSSHQNWKVRNECLTLVHTTITQCPRNDYEKPCSEAFVEMTVSRLDDENPEVKRLAEKIVERLGELGSGDDDGGGAATLLREAAATSLLRVARTLPQTFGRVNDAEKLRRIHAVKGYLTVLGTEGIKSAIASPSGSINKLFLAFMQILDMDVDDLRIIQRLPSNTLNTLVDSNESFKPKIRFRTFTDDRVQAGIEDCLRLLGKHCQGHLYDLCDYLVEYLEERNNDVSDKEIIDGSGGDHVKQIVFMLNQILVGATAMARKKEDKRSCTLKSFIKDTLLPLYLSNSLLHARCEAEDDLDPRSKQKPLNRTGKYLVDSRPTRLIEELSSSIVTVTRTLPRYNSNILLVVLTLDGVSICAKSSKLSFRPSLIHALYPVVEKMASEITMVQDAAYATLKQMAVGCGYETIADLLLGNSDYVVNQLRSELRHGFIFARKGKATSDAPRVLAAMLKNAGPDLLPLLKDTIEEVLSCLDTTGSYEPARAKVFLRVLSSLVFYVNQWFGPSEQNSGMKKEDLDVEHTTDYLKEYWKNLQMTQALDDDDDNDVGEDLENLSGDDCPLEEPTSEDPPLPYHARLMEDVMMRCIYYMPDDDPRIRVLVLDVARHCCKSLANYENCLLPLAHKFWPSFVCRLKDKDRHVTLEAFQTLIVLSRTCGDFLLRRFTKDVLPALTSFMTSQGKISAGLATTTSRPVSRLLLNDQEERNPRRKDHGMGSGAAYKFTVAYRLQLAVLNNVGPLCQTIKVKVETGLDKIVDFLLLHLRLSQPTELQDAAKDALISLASIDADLAWMRVAAARGDFRDVCEDNAKARVNDGLSHQVLTEILDAYASIDHLPKL